MNLEPAPVRFRFTLHIDGVGRYGREAFANAIQTAEYHDVDDFKTFELPNEEMTRNETKV